MNKTLQRCVLLSGLFALSAMFAPSAQAIICCISHYNETVDAGDEQSAQATGISLTTGDPVDILVINGTLGGPDTSDAFSFNVGTSLDLHVIGDIGGAVSITLELWDAALTNLAQSSGLGTASLGPITLAPGTYIIEIELFGTDPDYTIQLSATPASAVPEPATLCLLSFGVAALGLRRRRLP